MVLIHIAKSANKKSSKKKQEYSSSEENGDSGEESEEEEFDEEDPKEAPIIKKSHGKNVIDSSIDRHDRKPLKEVGNKLRGRS